MVSKGQDNININDVREITSDDEVVSKYLGINSVPIIMLSPLRKDKNPSLSIFRLPDGNIGYKDFGTGEKGIVYDLLSKLWNISIKQVYRRIIDDYSPSNTLINKTKRQRKLRKSCTTLNVKTREWRDWDLEYWNKYGISKEWLEYAEVYPISTLFFNNDKTTIPAEKYAYVYVERKQSNS